MFFTSLNQWYSTFNSWRATSPLTVAEYKIKREYCNLFFMVLPNFWWCLSPHTIFTETCHGISFFPHCYYPCFLLVAGKKREASHSLPWLLGWSDFYSYLAGGSQQLLRFPPMGGGTSVTPTLPVLWSVLPALPDRVERRSDAYTARAACRASRASSSRATG